MNRQFDFKVYTIIYVMCLIFSWACMHTFLKMNDIEMKGIIIIANIFAIPTSLVVSLKYDNENE